MELNAIKIKLQEFKNWQLLFHGKLIQPTSTGHHTSLRRKSVNKFYPHNFDSESEEIHR